MILVVDREPTPIPLQPLGAKPSSDRRMVIEQGLSHRTVVMLLPVWMG